MNSTDRGATAEPPVRPDGGEGTSDAGGDEVTLATGGDVPDDAVAVDVPCPHCGANPIESVAKGYRITGMVLVMQRKTLQFVGCQPCIRRKLWWAAAKNLLVGWWGIKSAIVNPFAIGWNVFRGLVRRGPNENLVAALEESGIPYEFVGDRAEFDRAAHRGDELLLHGVLQLGTAVTMADGEAAEEEVEAVLETATEMFPDYGEAEIEERMRAFAGEGVDVAEVGAALGTMLTDGGKQLVLAFAVDVAAVDGVVEREEAELIGEVAGALGLSDEQVTALLGE